MPDLFLGPLVNGTVTKVVGLALGLLVNSAVGLWKQDVDKFCSRMRMLGGLLQDADAKHLGGQPRFKEWLLKLKAVAEDAEDVFEAVSYENLRQQVQFQNSKWKKVSSYCTGFSKSHPLVFPFRMASKLKSLNTRLDEVHSWANDLGLQSSFANTSAPAPETILETHSFLPSEVVGREKEVSEIVSLLVNSGSHDQLPVITIAGLPGLGKTTLAKAVLESNEMQRCFGKNTIWVCVSENFDVKQILVEILESVTRSSCGNLMSLDTLLRKIQERLDGGKYFLVLDDVWNEERSKWEDFRRCLLGISKTEGSMVLVTTRSQKVAELVSLNNDHIYPLGGLSENECWTIIQQRAFGSSTVPEELEKIGREIARKCSGLPLVADVIGGVLRNVRDKKEWMSIKGVDSWGSLDKASGILSILQMSFDRLPSFALKQCFTFCSIFPKDYVMEKEVLVELWMAEGYLQPLEGSSMDMEEIGDQYFDDLLSYSLFQGEEKDFAGRFYTCKMHDLIHDLAQFVSESEILILETSSGRKLSSSVRHLNIIDGDGKAMASILDDAAPEKLQTLLAERGQVSGLRVDLKRLRVLNVCDAKELPTCFGKSKGLRYLDISRTQIEKLPKFITQLYKLQTLRFEYCQSLKMPDGGVENLINLRHIYFSDEERMPENLGRLTNLQTLHSFYVGKTSGRGIEELGSLRKLKGGIWIRNLEHVKSRSEAEKAKLHEKAIKRLVLSWGKECNRSDDVAEGFQPPSSLQRLTIRDYGGYELPSWILKAQNEVLLLSNLVKLSMDGCRKLKSIPSLTRFSCLVELEIQSCNELTSMENGATSLRSLSISSCPKLKSVSVSGLSLLQNLRVSYCKEVSDIGESLSTSTSLKELSLLRCHSLSFIPNLNGLTCLQSVYINECNGLKSMPSGLSSCSALEDLVVSECGNLEFIPEELKELRSLVRLDISNCQKLMSIPVLDQNIIGGLKILGVGGFSKELEEFPDLVLAQFLTAIMPPLKY